MRLRGCPAAAAVLMLRFVGPAETVPVDLVVTPVAVASVSVPSGFFFFDFSPAAAASVSLSSSSESEGRSSTGFGGAGGATTDGVRKTKNTQTKAES